VLQNIYEQQKKKGTLRVQTDETPNSGNGHYSPVNEMISLILAASENNLLHTKH
jgi:hypothetical protein